MQSRQRHQLSILVIMLWISFCVVVFSWQCHRNRLITSQLTYLQQLQSHVGLQIKKQKIAWRQWEVLKAMGVNIGQNLSIAQYKTDELDLVLHARKKGLKVIDYTADNVRHRIRLSLEGIPAALFRWLLSLKYLSHGLMLSHIIINKDKQHVIMDVQFTSKGNK